MSNIEGYIVMCRHFPSFSLLHKSSSTQGTSIEKYQFSHRKKIITPSSLLSYRFKAGAILDQ